MKAFWICAIALLLTCTERGFSQTVPCSLEQQCTNIFLVNSVEECCSQAGTLTFRTSVDAELCQNCFIYGWVQDIAEDRMSANPQEDIPATPEGEIITLNLYFTKNGPSNVRGLLLDIETSGTAKEGVDYTLSRSSNLPLATSPVPVNVTLLRDGEAGEPLETIILSLVQVNEPDISQILDPETVQITVQGSITIIIGYEFSVYNVSEGTDVVNLCAVISVPTTGAAPRDFVLQSTIHDGTAVSGIHYASMADKKLSFHDRTHSVCHTVIITGNRSCEIVYFFATLQYVSGMMPIIIDPSTTRVIIDGTNGKECEVLDTTSEGEKDKKDSNTLIIALSVVAVILVLLLVLISIFAVIIARIQCVRKRKEKGQLSEKNMSHIYDVPDFMKSKDKSKGKEQDSGQISRTERKENIASGLSTSEQHTPTIL